MHRVAISILFVVMVLATVVTASTARADAADEQRLVAKKFLAAYLLNDMGTVRNHLPTDSINLFGPYPFKGKPRFGAAKVDDHQALVDFTATMGDRNYPTTGGILFYKQPSGWYVRQILFYDHVPRIFNLPTESVTAQDEKYEPAVKALAKTFIDAWERGDTAKMLDLWHNWTKKDRDPIKGLSVHEINIIPSTTTWKDPFVKFSAKLTYKFGILSYSMTVRGGFILVAEGSNWKVRANQFIFDF